MTDYNNPLGTSPLVRSGGSPVFSAFSILAVVCALFALFNVVGAGLSFFLAIAAIGFGLLGMIVALLPSRRGGIVSFLAAGLGLLGVVIAIFRLLGSHPANSGY